MKPSQQAIEAASAIATCYARLAYPGASVENIIQKVVVAPLEKRIEELEEENRRLNLVVLLKRR
jgi:hypothetical protein